ncbi:MAG: hypothetical protein JXB62_22520 [Pirellulales bacterium]|nr:hypothetical protein [Pirellulales bacterium]
MNGLRRSRIAAAACIGVLLAACMVRAEEFEVSLAVEESAGVERQDEPISGGVPLPKGAFAQTQSFTLFRDGAEPVPCQVSPLVVETDATLRWILLDLRDDVAAGATARYVLRATRSAVRPKRPLKIEDTPEDMTIDTGRMELVLSKQRPFGLFDRVAVGGRAVVGAGRVSYVQLQGRAAWDDKNSWQPRLFLAGPPDSVTLRHAGPLRVTVEIKGPFADDPSRASYQAWITTWADSSRVAVKYKLCNSNPQQYTAILVAGSTIELPLGEPAKQVLLGAAEPITAGGNGWIRQGLLLHDAYQDVSGAVKAGSGPNVLWTGNGPKNRPGGWIAAVGGGTVFVCDNLFSSNPARRLAVAEGKLVLEGIAERFEGPKDEKFKKDRRIGRPWQSDGFWLYDCSHHSSEYLFDFSAAADAAKLDAAARAARSRLWVRAPGEHYSDCDVLGTGRFATLEEEKACYRKWGWTFRADQVPNRKGPLPGAFVAREDNHYESEADSVQGLLLMYLRTGQRGWFDQGEAWARYHMDLQAWRTDGWRWKDGGIWFPQGGPQGNQPVRQKWNFAWGPNWGDRQDSPECTDLWTHAQSKSCYCHYYGSGLADYYCLTGDPDALAAAMDNVEQKDDEFRHFRNLRPGESAVDSIRGFGRGFEVAMRVLMADPQNQYVRDLCHLCARTLWQSPLLDERGLHCSQVGGGWGGMDVKQLSPNVRAWMDQQGIRFTTQDGTVDTLSKGSRSWQVRCMGGTWQHVYIHNGADLYARHFDDENLRDFTIAFAQMSARYMLSPKCHQTWYYTYFDVPDLGMVFDPWAFDHTETTDGMGCVHSGWYTCFYPDACAKGYCLTGEGHLLAKAREFWGHGSRRAYQTRSPGAGEKEVGRFASHTPPKDDTVLEVSRLLYAASHPRQDAQPPAAVTDLQVRLLGGGKAEVHFTAPGDLGGGRVVRYQLKVATLPIVPYEEFDYARDAGRKRNWWRAVNCEGEPAPSEPGAAERFIVTGVPSAPALHFTVRSFDDSQNRSAIGVPAVAR